LSPDDAQPRHDVPPAGPAPGAGPAGGGGGGGAEPTEEGRSEIDQRAAYEAELSRLTSTDVIAQAVVSLLNIGARRLAPAAGAQPGGGEAPHPERDLEQARDAIDAVRALLEIVERRIPSRELGPLRDALSRLQMAYAQEVGAGTPAAPQEQGPTASEQHSSGPGPAESSGRLWVPGR
jgi:hypothetical protein